MLARVRPGSGGSITAEDERAIAQVLVRYATAIDTRDWPLLRSCFSCDCEADYGSFGSWRGLREISEFMEGAHRQMGPTLHRITNVVIDSGQGEVTARSYVDAILTNALHGGRTHRSAGYYDDVLRRTAEGWKISRRRFNLVDSSGA